MTEAKVYIVDDDEDVLKSLKWLIESVGYAVETAANAEEFLEVFQTMEPGCIVLDVRMPGMSGLELQEQLAQQGIKIPIIFITGHGDVPMAVRAMKSGAIEFLTKPVNNQTLIETINKAIKQDSSNRLIEDQQEAIITRAMHLTNREYEVMKLVVEGNKTKAIAAQLHISPNTVELHRAKVMKKMEVKSVAELVSLALTGDLLTARNHS